MKTNRDIAMARAILERLKSDARNIDVAGGPQEARETTAGRWLRRMAARQANHARAMGLSNHAIWRALKVKPTRVEFAPIGAGRLWDGV